MVLSKAFASYYYTTFFCEVSMVKHKRIKQLVFGEALALLCLLLVFFVYKKPTSIFVLSHSATLDSENDEETDSSTEEEENSEEKTKEKEEEKKKFIKWVDFNASYEALNVAYDYDVESQSKDVKLNWIELLAYAACKGGGSFSKSSLNEINTLADKLSSKESNLQDITKDMKYYPYYLECYTAILGGLVGNYEIEVADEQNPEQKVWVHKYGLKAFFPIAKGFPYSDYDDFGVSRSYGYTRNHLGHDMMGQVGSPIVCVESGYVEAIGWNQYGGWRLGIRSLDKKRYYYYAHLRQNFPYNKSLKEGSIVQAGDIIGYMGHTGYSAKENVNNINQVHLHFGLQLIFDESQKECVNEIWIDCYNLVRFLAQNKSEAVKDQATKEWHRIYQFKDPAVEDYQKQLTE